MFVANIGLGLSGSFTITSSALNASLAMSCIWVGTATTRMLRLITPRIDTSIVCVSADRHKVFTYAMSAAPIGFVVAAETATPRLKSLTTGFAIGCYGALK
jgi:hypothetical protein